MLRQKNLGSRRNESSLKSFIPRSTMHHLILTDRLVKDYFWEAGTGRSSYGEEPFTVGAVE